jgi:hypothetical protein
VVPVCALSLARGSAPLRRPRTATQGTRDCHEFTVTCAWMPRKTRHVSRLELGYRTPSTRCAGAWRSATRSWSGPQGGATRYSCGSWRARNAAARQGRRRPGAPLERVPDHHQHDGRGAAGRARGAPEPEPARARWGCTRYRLRGPPVPGTPAAARRAVAWGLHAQTDAAAPAARARPRGRPSRARGARARRAGRGCRRRPRRRAAAPAAPATHPIACFEMLCFDRKIRGTGVLSKTRELG